MDFGRLKSRNILYMLMVLLLSARAGTAEIIHHLRDFRDQADYPENPRNMSNKNEAKAYLEKYGFMNCSLSHVGLDFSSHMETDDGVPLRNCTEDETQLALQQFQELYDLRQTAELDPQTVEKMSEGRCGDKDSVKRRPAKSFNRRPRSRPAAAIASHSRTYKDANFLSVHEADGLSSSKSVTKSSKSKSKDSSHPRVRRGLNKRHEPLLKTIYSPVIVEGESVQPRKHSQEHDFKDRLKRTAEEKLKRKQRRGSDVFLELISEYKQRVKRKKRSLTWYSGKQFDTDIISWYLPEEYFSNTLPEPIQPSLVGDAFRMWSEVSTLKFRESSSPDVKVAFAEGRHLGCVKQFDGKGGDLGHTIGLEHPEIHFDNAEQYKDDSDAQGVDLRKVALHEVGHVLGLEHSDSRNSVMYPFLEEIPNNFELPVEDRQYIQALYGVCKGDFDIVFDWLRPQRPVDPDSPRLVYNTYFFRRGMYWMYENRHERPRYGDPLHIRSHWSGLPLDLDTYMQMTQKTSNPYVYHIETYFFKGPDVYRYNDIGDHVAHGYPKRIADEFGAQSNVWEPIPNNLDAAFYNMEDNVIYFFKDQWVWVYPANNHGVNDSACCVEKIRFSELFPVQNINGPNLSGHIDTVYFSYQTGHTYVFHGDRVYLMTKSRDSAGTRRRWQLDQLGSWYDSWFDICDV